MKPTLDLYIGHYVARIDQGELPWQWAIVFDSGMEIRNKDKREVFQPRFEEIVGSRMQTVSMSLQDTTIYFSNEFKWSLNPTQYAIFDPAYEGESYPQWPDDLEEAGIPSVPDGDVSAPPGGDWETRRRELENQRHDRIMLARDGFLEEDK